MVKKLCARPPPQPPLVPLKRGRGKRRPCPQPSLTPTSDSDSNISAAQVSHMMVMGAFLSSMPQLGGTDLQNDAYGQVWPRLLDKENQRQGYGVSIRTRLAIIM